MAIPCNVLYQLFFNRVKKVCFTRLDCFPQLQYRFKFLGAPEVFIEHESIEINETESLTIICQVKSLIPMLVQLKWHDRVLEEVKVE